MRELQENQACVTLISPHEDRLIARHSSAGGRPIGEGHPPGHLGRLGLPGPPAAQPAHGVYLSHLIVFVLPFSTVGGNLWVSCALRLHHTPGASCRLPMRTHSYTYTSMDRIAEGVSHPPVSLSRDMLDPWLSSLPTPLILTSQDTGGLQRRSDNENAAHSRVRSAGQAPRRLFLLLRGMQLQTRVYLNRREARTSGVIAPLEARRRFFPVLNLLTPPD